MMEQLDLMFPKRKGRQRIPLEQRFWAKVDKNGPVPEHMPHLGPCWVWTAARNSTGYGVLSKGGKRRADLHQAHRLSWQLHHGDAGDLFVCHRCDNPSCVRPDHLFLGTAADNMRDMRAKGRSGRGKAGPCESKWEPPVEPRPAKARLTEPQVRDIRARHAAGETRASLAEHFGISTMMVGYIVRGRYWAHVA